jgi:hypothetical protein
LVKCENSAEEDLEIINGMGHYLQAIQDGRDEELAFFLEKLMQEPLRITRD